MSKIYICHSCNFGTGIQRTKLLDSFDISNLKILERWLFRRVCLQILGKGTLVIGLQAGCGCGGGKP